jgi:hypothetical protein
MRMITGAVLILAAEQAFAHAHQIGFPHQVFAREILLPASVALMLVGVGLLVWGVVRERKSP